METKATITVTNCYGTTLNVSEVVLYTIISPDGELLYKIEGRGYSGGHYTTAMIDIKEDKREALSIYARLLKQLLKAQEQEGKKRIKTDRKSA